MSSYKVLKYIVIDDDGIEKPIIFTGLDQHGDIALKMGKEVISAGFIAPHDNGMLCYGESISLKIKSRPEDTKMINGFFMGIILSFFLIDFDLIYAIFIA